MKKLVCLILAFALIFSLCTTASASQYINWETEPNNDFSSAKYAIPYTYDYAINQGVLGNQLTDVDMWWFFTNQAEDYIVSLDSPTEYDGNFRIYEELSDTSKVLLYDVRFPYGQTDYITLPGGSHAYYIEVYTDYRAVYGEVTTPYMLFVNPQ